MIDVTYYPRNALGRGRKTKLTLAMSILSESVIRFDVAAIHTHGYGLVAAVVNNPRSAANSLIAVP